MMLAAIERRMKNRVAFGMAVFAVVSFGCDPESPNVGPIPRAAEIRRIDVSSKAGAELTPDRRPESSSRLDRLKAERLAIVDEVALFKWIRNKPIEDPARENAVLDGVESRAAELGIDAAGARRFFESLMANARERQRSMHEKWSETGPPADAHEPDLEQLRKRIDRLTPQLLEAWAESERLRKTSGD